MTGQRDDGYHLLDSLVVFADYGDDLTVSIVNGRADGDHRLTIQGPFADGLAVEPDNLVLRAARLFETPLPALDVTLVKNLPVASGIGGGSSDAATTISLISKICGITRPSDAALLTLGADVPVCHRGEPVRMRGIGEDLSAVPPLPDLAMVLINPGVGVSTPAVFKGLERKDNPAFSVPETGWPSTDAFIAWLHGTRNDLEAPARTITPEVERCLSVLGTHQSALFSRMSGSGATCFALFRTLEDANKAADEIRAAFPDWWICASLMGQ